MIPAQRACYTCRAAAVAVAPWHRAYVYLCLLRVRVPLCTIWHHCYYHRICFFLCFMFRCAPTRCCCKALAATTLHTAVNRAVT